MENKRPAFVSYARVDSSFAHRLAADLKSNGASVWLDQLDIRLGRQWDREIQQALTACSEVLVILSPASIESDHVMNEVRYALDERIPVIPVLYTECHVPFHLRRLQFVDFREDYEFGLKTLLSELTGEHRIIAAQDGPEHAATEVSHAEVLRNTEPERIDPGQQAGEARDMEPTAPLDMEPTAPLPQASRRRVWKALAVGAAAFLVLAAAGVGAYRWMFHPDVPATAPVRQADLAPQTISAPAPAATTPPATAPTITVPVVLGDGLPIRLTLAEDVPGDALEGDPVRFQVAHDVSVEDTVVIPKGAEAIGAIVDGAKKKILGRVGTMTFRLEGATAVDGRKVTIRATPSPNGLYKRPLKPATAGAEYLGYIEGSNTVTVTKIAR